jgi:hypothetical protein
MEDNPYRAITRHDFLPALLAVADASLGGAGPGGGHAAFARYLYQDLMFTVAGTPRTSSTVTLAAG